MAHTDSITVTINNWDKHNPRKDIKRPTWFSVDNRMIEDPDFFAFNHGEFKSWIYILSRASQKHCGTIDVHFDHAERVCGIKKSNMNAAIEKLLGLHIVTVSVRDPYVSVRNPYAHVTHTNPTDRQTDRQTHPTESHSSSANEPTAALIDPSESYPPESLTRKPMALEASTLDQNKKERPNSVHFEKLYLGFPRKCGKQRGMAICKAQILSFKDLEELALAIDNYVCWLKIEKQEPKFYQHFSTFMGRWRDWLEENAGTSQDFSRKAVAVHDL